MFMYECRKSFSMGLPFQGKISRPAGSLRSNFLRSRMMCGFSIVLALALFVSAACINTVVDSKHLRRSYQASAQLGITSCQPTVASKYFYGGAQIPYYAGRRSTNGLIGTRYEIGFLTPHFPGFWGPGATHVYLYHYSTVTNKTSYNVDCFCGQRLPCSCDNVSDQTYFDGLPKERFRTVANGNHTTLGTTLYVNGTLEPKVSNNEGSRSLMSNLIVYAILILIVSFVL
jgi:hypothetical protein